MQEKAGLYFHIPFCRGKCPYCDFYSIRYNCREAEEYTNKIINEIEEYSGVFDTVYFGGGTPSIIEPELIGNIINAAKKQFEIDENSEITIECNPSKDLKECFKKYKSYGINRISLGMQSAVDSERFALGRSAGKLQVESAINDARNAGIENISLDVMLGTPKQTLSSLDETFDFIDKMQVQHISAYMLKIEEGTRFFKMQDKLDLPDDDTTAEMYLKTVNTLASMGLKQYEISNFAKQGYESRHNTKYWRLVPYLGIGATAHSFWNGKRFYYNSNMNVIQDGLGGDEQEKIMLGLRLCEGVEKELIKKPYRQFITAGLITESPNRISLTPKGMLVSNTIINELI
ncbi:MAG: radical SAM family heme chaperone HemW [Eubacterium sp.]